MTLLQKAKASWDVGSEVHELLSTMLNPKVIKRAHLTVLTSVGSVAAKSKEEKRQTKEAN